MPITTPVYHEYPLTSGKPTPPSLRTESFHMAVGHLRCFNASLTDSDKGILFNWYARDNVYIGGAKKVPPYTDLFWIMFFTTVRAIVPLKKIILQVGISH